MSVKVKKPKAPGDSTLQALWRKVVRQEWAGVCALGDLGETCMGDLEAHHIIKRRRPHLKHVPSNGILLCQHHHNLVETFPSWRHRVSLAIGEDKAEWLEAEARKLFPQFLAERGQTRAEYFIAQKAYLSALLNGGAQ